MSGLWAGHGFAVLRLLTRPWNFLLRNARKQFVICGEAPSCIHHNEERVATYRSLGQTVFCSRQVTFTIHWCQIAIIVRESMLGWNPPINKSYKNHHLHIIPIIRFENFMWINSRPHSIVLSMKFLMKAEELFICPNNSLDEFRFKFIYFWITLLEWNFIAVS